jgi:hypothetical protein
MRGLLLIERTQTATVDPCERDEPSFMPITSNAAILAWAEQLRI